MWPPSGKGSIPAPEKDFEPVLGQFEQTSGVPKKEQEKGIGANAAQRSEEEGACVTAAPKIVAYTKIYRGFGLYDSG